MEAHVPVMSGGPQGPYPTGAFMSMSNGAITQEKLYTTPTLTATVPGPTTPGKYKISDIYILTKY